jgi:hypothetical protein
MGVEKRQKQTREIKRDKQLKEKRCKRKSRVPRSKSRWAENIL